MSTAAPDWPRIIRQSSPADLGWSADSPAPQEALDAIDEARDTSWRFLASSPFIERWRPFTWWPESSRVAALLVAEGPLARVQVDPRTPGAEGLGDVQAAALLARAHYRGRARRRADDGLMAELGAALREQRGGTQ